MGVNKTSISAGEIIRHLLMESAEVKKKTNKIYPVIEDKADLPYIVYRRISQENVPVNDRQGADTIAVEVLCLTQKYTQGVELAEAVRYALEGKKCTLGDLTMRSCVLVDGEETWQADAYIQQLVFNIKI